MELNRYDLQWCVRRLPSNLRKLMKKEEITVGGGFIRSCIFNEKPNDIDLFVPDKDWAKELALFLSEYTPGRLVHTPNAITIRGPRPHVQFITRWLYEEPQDVIPSFDFTLCQAIFWWDHYCGKWKSLVSDEFYPALAAKRLEYTNPDRNEDAGGSLLRVLKYYQKGFRITIPSFSDVMTRLIRDIDFDEINRNVNNFPGQTREERISWIIRGLLREVDPNIDPDHIVGE